MNIELIIICTLIIMALYNLLIKIPKNLNENMNPFENKKHVTNNIDNFIIFSICFNLLKTAHY